MPTQYVPLCESMTKYHRMPASYELSGPGDEMLTYACDHHLGPIVARCTAQWEAPVTVIEKTTFDSEK